jgi:hypothetical protein
MRRITGQLDDLGGKRRRNVPESGMRTFTIGAVICAVALAITAIPVRAADADAEMVAAGRELGRTILIFRNPQNCAPVIRLARCLRDLSDFMGKADGNERLAGVPNVGPKPYDRLVAYINDGDVALIDRSLPWFSGVVARYRETPRAIELVDAGIASTLFAGANGVLNFRPSSLGATVDAARAPAVADLDLMTAPERTLLAGLGSTNVKGGIVVAGVMTPVMDADEQFARRTDARFPAPAFPAIRYSDAPIGMMKLGVASAALGEMLTLPELSALPESRAFASTAIERMTELVPDQASNGDAALDAMTAHTPERRKAGLLAYATLQREVLASKGHPKDALALVVGFNAERLGFNAATSRDVKSAADLISQYNVLLGIPQVGAELKPTIGAMTACAASDFTCERREARRIVDTILQN